MRKNIFKAALTTLLLAGTLALSACGKKAADPVLRSDREKGFYGPGHNSFTKTEDGSDVCVFHARTYLEIVGDPLYDPNRHTMLMEVKWNEAGEPIFDYMNMVKFN